ncbi:Rha family transcriptional regulator [Ensifer adhaerens]
MNAILGNQPVTMSSREIAELTGKRHDHVKRDVEKMLAELGEDAPKFGGIYFDSMNRQQEEYRLDRELTETLLLGYSAPLRRKVIKRLRELEAAVSSPRPLTTTETLIQMLQLQAEVERRQEEQSRAITAVEQRVDLIAATAPITAKPQNSETISEIRLRISRKHGLPQWTIDEVMFQLPSSPKPFAMVKNGHENAQGSSFAVWMIKDVTKLFDRFVADCEPVTATTAKHPYIDRRFKLIRRE